MNNREKNSYVRGQILRALLELLDEKELGSVSVSELTERAGVGRASFYRNFESKEDVLRRESRRLTQEWRQRWESRGGEFGESLLNFYKERSGFYLALYRAGLFHIVLDDYLESLEIGPGTPNAEAYLKSALAYMTYGWVVEWVRRGMPESGSELARMIREARAEAVSG